MNNPFFVARLGKVGPVIILWKIKLYDWLKHDGIVEKFGSKWHYKQI